MLAIVTSHPIQYQAPLWRALATAGVKFEVWFLTPHAVKPSYDREFDRTFAWDTDLLRGYPYRFLPVREGWRLDRFQGIALTKEWRSLLTDAGVTSLWLEGWRFSTLWRAAYTGRRMGIRLLMRGETNALEPRSGLGAMARNFMLKKLFSRFDHFLFIGTANRRFYEQRGISSDRLTSTPYSVDNTSFSTLAREARKTRESWRRHHGIPSDAVVPLFCGKLISKKRPLDFVQAAAHWQASFQRRLHLLFAGDGELKESIRLEMEKNGLQGTMLGFCNQSTMPAIYAAADLLALPSDYGETWGLVINEAMASGLPCAVSDRCGCAEDLVGALDPRRVAPCGDTARLAQAMAACLDPIPLENQRVRSILDQHDPKTTAAHVSMLLHKYST